MRSSESAPHVHLGPSNSSHHTHPPPCEHSFGGDVRRRNTLTATPCLDMDGSTTIPLRDTASLSPLLRKEGLVR